MMQRVVLRGRPFREASVIHLPSCSHRGAIQGSSARCNHPSVFSLAGIVPVEVCNCCSLCDSRASKKSTGSRAHGHDAPETISEAKISFCVALMNRGENFLKMLASWRALHDDNFELVVADFGSTDVDVRGAIADTRRARIVQLHGPFNRSVGLNAAAAGATGELLFFLDADLVLPKEFCSTVRAHVRPGQAYFPICYSLRQGSPPDPSAAGWWRHTGFGLCGFHRDDFARIRWDESFTRWGGEDNELFKRAGTQLQIHRRQCPSLFHVWHPDDLAFKSRYQADVSSANRVPFSAQEPDPPHAGVEAGPAHNGASDIHGDASNCEVMAPPSARRSFHGVQDRTCEVTFGITSFERPQCLQRLVASIFQYYPAASIVVADNGRRKASLPKHVEVLDLPFDCGVSAARSALVARLRTPYILLLEEDVVFTRETRIDRFIEILDCDRELGSVGGSLRIGGKIHDYAVDFRLFRGRVCGQPAAGPVRFTPTGIPYRICDKHYNFGIWRREMLESPGHAWDGLPKIGEHAPYFWRVKQAGEWRVAHTPTIIAEHDLSGRTTEYGGFRRRAGALQREWFASQGLPNGYSQPSGIGIEGLNDTTEKANVVILGVGHSGTSILAKMLFAAGWNAGDADQEYGESVTVRRLNERALKEGSLDSDQADAVLGQLSSPWALKDPRFVFTLDRWIVHLAKLTKPPTLVWIRRNSGAVAGSYIRRGELRGKHAEDVVARRLMRCHELFATWVWPKLAIDFERLSNAAGLFLS